MHGHHGWKCKACPSPRTTFRNVSSRIKFLAPHVEEAAGADIQYATGNDGNDSGELSMFAVSPEGRALRIQDR